MSRLQVSVGALAFMTATLALGGGCELIAGLKDRELAAGGTGGTTSSSAGAGGTGGTTSAGGTTSSGGIGGTGGGTGGTTSMGGTGGTTSMGGTGGTTGGTGGVTGGTGGGGPVGCAATLNVTTIVSGEASPVAIALDANNIYWANDLDTKRAIRKSVKGSNVAGDLVVVQPKKPLAITVSGPYLYWSEERVVPCDAGILDPDNDRILRVDVGGQLPPQPLHASCGKSTSLVVQGGKLYRARPTANRVQRSNLDGTSLFAIYDGTAAGSAPFGLAVDGTNAYWTDTAHGVLSYCDHTGVCTAAKFADAPGADTRVVDDATTVYWTTSSDVRKLDKASPGGSPVVLGTITSTGGIALDNDAVYVTDTLEGKVLRFCKSDGQMTEIATGQLDPRGIAADASGVYWVNGTDGSVRRAAP